MQLYVCLSYRIGTPSTWSSWSAWSCTVCGSRSGVLNRHRTCTGTCTYTCAINSTSTALGANCSGGERVTSAGLWNLAIYFYFYALIEEVVGGKRGQHTFSYLVPLRLAVLMERLDNNHAMQCFLWCRGLCAPRAELYWLMWPAM